MSNVLNFNKKPAHLPERLTISFPIWGLYSTDKNDVYYDFDKMMREHAERGFNCIRLDDGAGLMHDLEGTALPPVELRLPFGKYTEFMRQNNVFKSGKCDLHKRLIEMFTAAKKYNIFIILSSWYYLHTYWIVANRKLNDFLVYSEPHSRYDMFAKYLHYIICELEERGLDSQIAFAEIFNEADGLDFSGGYDNMHGLSDEALELFRKEHENAIAWLKEKHPGILFAYDNSRARLDTRLVPRNADIYNFHNYFMWGIYTELEKRDEMLKKEPVTISDVRTQVEYPDLMPEDWYKRVAYYSSIDTEKMADAQDWIHNYLKNNISFYEKRLDESINITLEGFNAALPESLLVCGEGVTYCGHTDFTWEEKSEAYWSLVKRMIVGYRNAGLWGTVIRTCCGPEDKVWNMCADKLLELNNLFLKG